MLFRLRIDPVIKTTRSLINMNFPLVALALFVTITEAWEIRPLQDDRKLQSAPGVFDFLISNASQEPLCITAADGMRNFGNLKLMPCDFETFPAEQLWNYEDAKFYNDIGISNSKCMVVNHGKELWNGVRVRLADCADSLLMTSFLYDGEFIRVASDETYCLTNRGDKAQAGDTIHAKPCLDRDDFKWTHTDMDPRNDGGTLYSFYADDGCIQPKEGSAAKFTEIIMGECDARYAWNVKDVDGVKAFRSRLDLSMCLQAGLGGYVDHGTKLRLMPCNENEELQKFEWSDETHIKLVSREELCLEWRGRNVNVGVDPVIMKSCDLTVYEGWSGDEVY